MSITRILTIASLPLVLAGCNWFHSNTPRSQLGAEAFYRPVPGAEDRRDTSPDRSGAIREAYLTPAPAEATVGGARAPSAVARTPGTIPSSFDATNAAAAPTSQPETSAAAQAMATLPPLAPGQFQLVGAVVVEVSGTPIYADKVVSQLTTALSEEAKHMNASEFRVSAATKIRNQVDSLIQSELFFRAANKELSNEDKERANLATMSWRDQQVREAGGSIELARRKAAAVGQSFEEEVQDHYRRVIVYLFNMKRLVPRVPITVEEMRRYYDLNRTNEFSVLDQAQFRVIKIMVPKTQGDTVADRRTNATEKIKQLREQVVDRSDEDFAKLASQINDDPALMKSGGRLGEDGWMKKGEYAVPKVEEEVWKLQVGQITDVIAVGDTYYIARLSDRKLGHAVPFEDPDVQIKIQENIRRPQLAGIQERELAKLREESVVYPPQPRLEPVLNMVMQKYPQWAAAGQQTPK